MNKKRKVGEETTQLKNMHNLIGVDLENKKDQRKKSKIKKKQMQEKNNIKSKKKKKVLRIKQNNKSKLRKGIIKRRLILMMMISMM